MVVATPILTPRLELRSMQAEHAALVWSIWGDLEMGKYLADEYYESPEVLEELFCDVDDWPDYSFVAFCRETGQFIGTCSIGPEGPEGSWGFGYCVTKAYWGQGFATEMASALMDFIRAQGVRDFSCTVATENVASCRVMEKCGLHFDHHDSFKKRGTELVYQSNIYRLHV